MAYTFGVELGNVPESAGSPAKSSLSWHDSVHFFRKSLIMCFLLCTAWASERGAAIRGVTEMEEIENIPFVGWSKTRWQIKGNYVVRPLEATYEGIPLFLVRESTRESNRYNLYHHIGFAQSSFIFVSTRRFAFFVAFFVAFFIWLSIGPLLPPDIRESLNCQKQTFGIPTLSMLQEQWQSVLSWDHFTTKLVHYVWNWRLTTYFHIHF